MPPFRDAVCFVNGYAAYGHAGIMQQVVDFWRDQSFRGNIDDFCLAPADWIHRVLVIFPFNGWIQKDRIHASRIQSRNLVLHERDKRWDYDGQSFKNQSWNLIAKRLSAAGWHNSQCIFFCKHIRNNFFLKKPKRIIPKHAFKNDFRFCANKIHIFHNFLNILS